MSRLSVYVVTFLTVVVITVFSVAVYSEYFLEGESSSPDESMDVADELVPNVVHFIRFGDAPLTFIDAVCVLAAWKHQKPDGIYVHTDQRVFNGGPYWDVVKSEVGNKVEVKYRAKPLEVFGKPLSQGWINFHAGDVARLQVLMEYGGIFLDNDSYIVKSLDEFRKFEMTLGWQEGGNLSNQVLIARKTARFLKLWFESYRDYHADRWFYNAGEKPTIDILVKRPYLIHRVRQFLAEWIGTPQMIYLDKSDAWRQHYAIHLLIRHQYILGQNLSSTATYPVDFNEHNILNYDANIKYMALDVYPFNRTSTH